MQYLIISFLALILGSIVAGAAVDKIERPVGCQYYTEQHLKHNKVVIVDKPCGCNYCHSGDFTSKVKPNERWKME